MLCNENYRGDAPLQKTYIADLFTRQSKKNNGELPQYYVHDCHPAIIDELTFQRVQEEIARRSSLKKVSASVKTDLAKYSGKYVLTEILSCGNCGSPYRRMPTPQTIRQYMEVQELPLGFQAQADMGQKIMRDTNRVRVKVYVFATVLSPSRYKYVCF